MSELVQNPFRIAGQPWIARRGVRINGQVLEKTNAADEAGKDISDAKWSVRMRRYVPGATTWVDETVLTKSPTGAATGFYDHWFQLGATAYPRLLWEVVLIDTSIDATTASGKEESVLVRFSEPIVAGTVSP